MPIRCNVEGAGSKRVRVVTEAFAVADDEMVLDPTSRALVIPLHSDVIDPRDGRALDLAPVLTNGEPFEGELCDCELKFLRGLPGFTFSRDLRFTVTEV